MNILLNQMMAQANPSQVEGLMRFFKCGPGQYGEGDLFLGIKVPATRQVVKTLWNQCSMDELQECIASPYHEIRLSALLVLIELFRHAKKDPATQETYVNFYLSNTQHINNWDLVDLSCYPLLGEWLLDKDRSLLYHLASDGKTLWEQRIGIVSTMQFIRKGQLDDTYAIAEIFLSKPQPLHDLLQKAAGWLLREAGKRDPNRLRQFVENHATTMPRTMLRYAIEKFPEPERKALMAIR